MSKSRSYYTAKAQSMGLLSSSGGVTSKGQSLLGGTGSSSPTTTQPKVYNPVSGRYESPTTSASSAPTPTKTMSDQQKTQLSTLYNKAVQSGTGSDFLKNWGSQLSGAGYGDITQTLGISNTTPTLPTPPIVSPIKTPDTTLDTKVDMSKMKIVGDMVYDDKGTLLGSKDIVFGGKTPIQSQIQEATDMQKPTEATTAIDLGGMDKFGANAYETQSLDPTFLDRRNEKIIAGLGESAKDVTAVKAFLESQPGFKEASVEEQQNTIKNIVQQAVQKDASIMDSELPSVENQMEYAELMNERDLEDINRFKEESMRIADEMRQYNQEIANNLDSVIGQRFNAMESNFNNVMSSIRELETKANELFDVNKMIARQNQAKQLADTGILSGEQAAQAAQYSLQDYTMNVELQRAEIAKQMQEQITNALKEKTAMQDQILQQKGINETIKQGMMQNLNSMYAGIVEKAQVYLQNANNKMDEMITNANNVNIQVDMMSKGPLIQEKANQELVGQKLQQANINPAYRFQYVIDTITNIAPNLVGRATAMMRDYQKNGTFMQQDAQAFVAELMSKMQQSAPQPTSFLSESGINLGGTQTSGTQSSTPKTQISSTLPTIKQPGYNPSTGEVTGVLNRIA